jgi:hypothetical protein
MALTRLHTNWANGSYVNHRNYFLGQEEHARGPNTQPYFDRRYSNWLQG